MDSFPSLTLLALTGISLPLIVLLYLRSCSAWLRRAHNMPLPPGPRPLPIVGNMFDWPQTNQSVALRDICAQYGERSLKSRIIHSNVYRSQATFSTSMFLVST